MPGSKTETTSFFDRVTELEAQYVQEVLENQFSNSRYGEFIRRLEEGFAKRFGVRYAVAQVNGTATLHSALVAAGVGVGDEVIVPPLTMMSTTFSVLQAGAVPVFADVDPSTFTIDPVSIGACITPKTKAIITVSLFGLPPDMDPIMELATGHDLCVIEDNAQCFLGYYKNRIAGSIGHMASYSFQISKHLTCGEGGVLISDDEDIAERARRFGSLGYASVGADASKAKVTREEIQDPAYERHAVLGWNYRISDLSAAVALAQTERIEELVARRGLNANLYAEAHQGCSWLRPQVVPDNCVHSWWTYPLRLESKGKFDWRYFRKKYIDFGGDGIYAAWKPNYLEPVLRGHKLGFQSFEGGLCPVAESLQPKLLLFKTNYMDSERAERQAEALKDTIDFFRQ
jgi:perosamine synthetase